MANSLTSSDLDALIPEIWGYSVFTISETREDSEWKPPVYPKTDKLEIIGFGLVAIMLCLFMFGVVAPVIGLIFGL